MGRGGCWKLSDNGDPLIIFILPNYLQIIVLKSIFSPINCKMNYVGVKRTPNWDRNECFFKRRPNGIIT